MCEKRRSLFQTTVKKPDECTQLEIDDFVELILDGAQVDARHLKQTVIAHGSRLAFARVGEFIAGIAAVKRPSRHYVINVFKKAQAPNYAVNYELEIAWCCTAPKYRGRGICGHLVGNLFHEYSDRNFFATTTARNEAMIKIFTTFGFEKIGRPFRGRAEPIQLLTRRINLEEKHADGWALKVRAAASRIIS
jgi:ribosomal protein S18 acetylase RimI-like enzyme